MFRFWEHCTHNTSVNKICQQIGRTTYYAVCGLVFCGLDISKMEHLVKDLTEQYKVLLSLDVLPENIHDDYHFRVAS